MKKMLYTTNSRAGVITPPSGAVGGTDGITASRESSVTNKNIDKLLELLASPKKRASLERTAFEQVFKWA